MSFYKPSKSEDIDFNKKYFLHIRISVIITLVIFICLSLSFQKFPEKPFIPVVISDFVLQVEDIPATRQGRLSPPQTPKRPAIPVESDDETIPENLTIEEYDFTPSDLPPLPYEGGNPGYITPPRPILEVLPEYSEKLRDKGIKGEVVLKLHVDRSGKVLNVTVIRNTSKSKELERAVIAAALKTRFRPAQQKGENIECFALHSWTFGEND